MPGVYDIHVKDQFTADHSLRGYDGKSAQTHGHKWGVEVKLRCSTLNRLGVGMDFKDVKKVVGDVLGRLNDTNLNDVVEFGSINPTAENLAKFLYAELGRCLNTDRITVKKVKVFETPDCGVAYSEVKPGE
ncbi:MAG: 6-carboxytetrahydropterin synthase [Desulfobacter sp.]|nr:MAG: 6-carboxytetrahydropterin synthase [Desulfobacter sp.]